MSDLPDALDDLNLDDLDTQDSDSLDISRADYMSQYDCQDHFGLFITFIDEEYNQFYTQCIHLKDFKKCLEECHTNTDSILALMFPFTSGWSSHHAYMLARDDPNYDVFAMIMMMLTRRGGFEINQDICPNIDVWQETFDKQIWECEPTEILVFKF